MSLPLNAKPMTRSSVRTIGKKKIAFDISAEPDYQRAPFSNCKPNAF